MTAASPRGRVPRMPSIDIVRESPLWDEQPDIDTALRSAIAEASVDVSTKNAELAMREFVRSTWSGAASTSPPMCCLFLPRVAAPGKARPRCSVIS